MPASRTYSAAFAHTVAAFGAPPAMAATLQGAFEDIAAEWAGHDPEVPPPFPSGVCPDGRPVEVSIRVRTDGRTHVRFIAQPAEPGLSEDRRAAWEADRARRFVTRWGGENTRAHLDAALSIYPDGPDPTFGGNFRLWLGLAADAGGGHGAKVYFNPWVSRPEYRGGLAIYHLLATSGLPGAGPEALLPWLQPEIGGTPHIVGWNLVDDRVTSVKLYVQAVLDARRLAVFAPDAWAPWSVIGVNLRPRGEVHVALTHDGVHRPTPRLNLFCPDWFRSDAEVVEALGAASPHIARALAGLLPSADALPDADSMRRRFTFVALDPDAVTAYCRIG